MALVLKTFKQRKAVRQLQHASLPVLATYVLGCAVLVHKKCRVESWAV